MQTNLVWTLKQLYLALDQYGKMQMQKMDLSPTQGGDFDQPAPEGKDGVLA